MQIPLATYRIQFNRDFNFTKAGDIVDYLASLGISHIYASPIFKAKAGSIHGYDIVDVNTLNPELGSGEDFASLITSVKDNGMYWLQDIVPNHMAFDSENTMLMDVLSRGERSPFYDFFDIDWTHSYEGGQKKLLSPFLGEFYNVELEDKKIQLYYGEDGLSVGYYNERFPLKAHSYKKVIGHDSHRLEKILSKDDYDFKEFQETIFSFAPTEQPQNAKEREDAVKRAKTRLWNLYCRNEKIKQFIDENLVYFNGKKGVPASFDPIDEILLEQNFKLAYWKYASEEINYRRFFAINNLICLKMENLPVFQYTHELIFKMVRDGLFNGFRIDHIDGLYDPAAYLDRLRQEAGDMYIVVEKILTRDETLNTSWQVQGTTGYDFLNEVNGLFCKGSNETAFTKIYRRFAHVRSMYHELMFAKKRLVIDKHLAGDVDNLAKYLKQISSTDRYGRDITMYGLKRALVEVLTHFPVYRTYVNSRHYSENDRFYFKEAIQMAKMRNPGLFHELNFIEKFLLMDFEKTMSDEDRSKRVHFVMNFQQYTGPLMAKGFEDTVLYIYNRLISFNEVGGDPSAFGSTLQQFHHFNQQRLQDFPHTLNATSTHDTKRGEDVRARINVLSEIPEQWQRQVGMWRRINRSKKKKVGSIYAPDKNDEYFLYQTLLGAYPFERKQLDGFPERIQNYMVKAIREAKIHTAWIKPDTDYEDACTEFVRKILKPSNGNKFLNEFLPFQQKIAFYGVFNSLAQTLLKITIPGVPDFYQGCELWDLNLVDPDNRRSVDYETRASFLHDIQNKIRTNLPALTSDLLADMTTGKVKLFLIYRALHARNAQPKLFQKGDYIPLQVEGTFADNIIAFARNLGGDWAVVAAPRFLTEVVESGKRLLGSDVWKDTELILPESAPSLWQDAITGKTKKSQGRLLIGEVLDSFPVAFLMNCQKS